MSNYDLSAVLSGLYRSEINCGVESFWDAGFDAWIGDDMNGRKAERTFDRREFGEIAGWLHAEALRLYPGSQYAKTCKRLSADQRAWATGFLRECADNNNCPPLRVSGDALQEICIAYLAALTELDAANKAEGADEVGEQVRSEASQFQ